MEVGKLFGKSTWVGFGITAVTIFCSLLLGAFLVVRGVLPYNAALFWLCAFYSLAVFLGGKIAERGQGSKTNSLIPALLLYLVIWVLALGCGNDIAFSSSGVYMTTAIFAGAIAAFVTGGGKKRRRGTLPKGAGKRRGRR